MRTTEPVRTIRAATMYRPRANIGNRISLSKKSSISTEQHSQSTLHAKPLIRKSDREPFYYVCDGKSGMAVRPFPTRLNWVKTPELLGDIPLLKLPFKEGLGVLDREDS